MQEGARFESVAAVRQGLRDVQYLADEGIAGVVYLADRLEKPVLVEGPAGTGKTQLAKSVAEMTGARLIRLQCYEGLDESKALYEWNYKKQLLRIQAERNTDASWSDIEENIFSEEFLLTRVPEITEHLADQVARIVRSIRQLELKKAPSVSETIDWARTLVLLNVKEVDAALAKETLPILLKYHSDITKAAKELTLEPTS